MAAPTKVVVVLKTVKKIMVTYCPWDINSVTTRDFFYHVGSETVRSTNINCEVEANVENEKSDPVVRVTYVDGEMLVMKGARLTTKEMLAVLHSRCRAKAKK